MCWLLLSVNIFDFTVNVIEIGAFLIDTKKWKSVNAAYQCSLAWWANLYWQQPNYCWKSLLLVFFLISCNDKFFLSDFKCVCKTKHDDDGIISLQTLHFMQKERKKLHLLMDDLCHTKYDTGIISCKCYILCRMRNKQTNK